MKKLILMGVCVLLLTIICACFYSCNYQMVDTTYKFDRAIINLPNGEVVEGPVDSWKDYEDGDQIQVKVNGKTYLIHSANVVLIKEK